MTPRSLAIAVAVACAGCAGTMPDTRYYQLAPPTTKTPGGSELLVLDSLTADAAYDDERIVYRTTPFRLDYYQYQHWSSVPGVMVANYLEQAFETSGKFRAVVRELTPDAPVVLAGRVIAIEEVDRSPTEWFGRICLELVLTDAHTGEALWTQQLEEIEPLKQRTPEGLAAALTVAMARISAHTIPVVAELTEKVARTHTDNPPTTASRAKR
jgi:ABC-type uncharacterized transport system auxiliary subunit